MIFTHLSEKNCKKKEKWELLKIFIHFTVNAEYYSYSFLKWHKYHIVQGKIKSYI